MGWWNRISQQTSTESKDWREKNHFMFRLSRKWTLPINQLYKKTMVLSLWIIDPWGQAKESPGSYNSLKEDRGNTSNMHMK